MHNNSVYHLCFVIHSLNHGGSERFLINLANCLSRRGHRILLILLKKENQLSHLLANEIDTIYLDRKYKYDLSVSLRIKKVLDQYQILNVICIEPFSFFLVKLTDPFSLKRKYYLSLHHSLPFSYKKRLKDILFLKLFSNSDTALFICRYQLDCFRKDYHFNPKSWSVIYNGIDTGHFSIDSILFDLSINNSIQFPELKFEDGAKVIVMIGRIAPEKDHKKAIVSLDYLYRLHGMRAHLVIVGGGDAQLIREMMSQIQEYNLVDYVHYYGEVEDVRPFLMQAHFFALTSISETFSLSALEALSMGVPCSLTNVGGSRELLFKKHLGKICIAGNPYSISACWASMLKKDYDRHQIRHSVKDLYSLEHMVNNYEFVFQLHNKLEKYSEAI